MSLYIKLLLQYIGVVHGAIIKMLSAYKHYIFNLYSIPFYIKGFRRSRQQDSQEITDVYTGTDHIFLWLPSKSVGEGKGQPRT